MPVFEFKSEFMKNATFIIAIILLFSSKIVGQSTFNKRFLFGYPVAALGSVLPTDSCYYATGIIVDSVWPFLVGNIFVKFDLEGKELFNKPLVSANKYYNTWVGDLIATEDGNLLDIGQITDSLYRGIIIKYNTYGDTVQTREYLSPYFPQTDFIVPYQVIQDSTGKIVVLNAIAKPNTDNDLSISIFDSQLNLISHKIYGNQLEELPGNEFLQKDDGYVVGANRTNYGQQWQNLTSRTYIFKVDSTGEKEWEYLSPAGIIQDIAQGIANSPDGGLVVASSKGYEHVINPTSSQIRWQSAYFFKLDENQQVVWDLEVFDSIRPSPGNEISRLISVDAGAAYIAAGKFNMIRSLDPPVGGTFGWLFKISDDGALIWTRKYQLLEAVGHTHKFFDLKQTSDGGFILAGEIRGNFGPGEPQLQAWLLKLDSHGCLVPGCEANDTVSTVGQAVRGVPELAIYPNPASDYLNFQVRGAQPTTGQVRFRILDAGGREVKSFLAHGLRDTFIVPVWDWAAGVYFLHYQDEARRGAVEKFVIVKR